MKKTVSGAYVSRGRVELTPKVQDIDIAFLYTKLSLEDKEWQYTSSEVSYHRIFPLKGSEANLKSYAYNGGAAVDTKICVAVPSNTGDYTSLGNCLIDRRKDKLKDPWAGFPGGAPEKKKRIKAFFLIPLNSNFETNPNGYHYEFFEYLNISGLLLSDGRINGLDEIYDETLKRSGGNHFTVVESQLTDENDSGVVRSSLYSVPIQHWFSSDRHESFFTKVVTPPADLGGWIGFWGYALKFGSEDFYSLLNDQSEESLAAAQNNTLFLRRQSLLLRPSMDISQLGGSEQFLSSPPTGSPLSSFDFAGDDEGERGYGILHSIIVMELTSPEASAQGELEGYAVFSLESLPGTDKSNWILKFTAGTLDGVLRGLWLPYFEKIKFNFVNKGFYSGLEEFRSGGKLPSFPGDPTDYNNPKHNAFFLSSFGVGYVKRSDIDYTNYTWGQGGGSHLYVPNDPDDAIAPGDSFGYPWESPYFSYSGCMPEFRGDNITLDGQDSGFRQIPGMFVSWEGSWDKIPAMKAYLQELGAYWGLTGNVQFFRYINDFGAGAVGDEGPDGLGEAGIPTPEDPIPPVEARLKGRFSEVWVNFQKQGESPQEVKLPIEFATRATFIKYVDGQGNDSAPYYSTAMPKDGDWQHYVNHGLAEHFTGRLHQDKDFIYVHILHGARRIWEEGTEYIEGGEFYNGEQQHYLCGENTFTLANGWIKNGDYFTPVMPGYYAELPDESRSSSYGYFSGIARPLKDVFTQINSYAISKQTLSIVATEISEYPDLPASIPIPETLGYTICDIENSFDFHAGSSFYRGLIPEEYSGSSVAGYEDIAIPQNPDVTEYAGLPALWSQTIYLSSGTAQPAFEFDESTFFDYIKPQNSWSEIDKIFWELGERHRILTHHPPWLVDKAQTVDFAKFGKYGGHGLTDLYKYAYMNYSIFNETEAGADSIPNYEAFYQRYNILADLQNIITEDERFRGSPLYDKDSNLVGWARVSPVSFPVIETVLDEEVK